MRPVSVVICTWNRADSLRLALESLAYLWYPDFEVVVVEGPCTDHTAEVLEPYQGRVKVVRTEARNLSASRNLGIADAAGEIVAFMDDDAVPDGRWLDDLIGAFDQEEVAATGGPVFDHTGYHLQARYNLSDRWGDARVETEARRLDFLENPDTWEFMYTIGTNSLFRRDLLVGAGGFDENFSFYLDETDVCLRFITQGYRVLTQTGGVVHHKFLPSEIRDSHRITVDRYQVVASRLYFAFRHGLRAANELRLWLSFGDFVRRHQTDLDDHVAGGRVPEDARRRFDADVERAYPVVLDQQAAPPATRPLDWFERSSSPFLRFETVSAPGRRHRLGLLSATLAPEVMSHAAGLAGAGHLVHVLVPEPGRASTVDFESGVWVHRLEAEDEVFERELARLAEFTPLDAVQIVGGAVDPSRLSAYPLADAAELGVPSALR